MLGYWQSTAGIKGAKTPLFRSQNQLDQKRWGQCAIFSGWGQCFEFLQFFDTR